MRRNAKAFAAIGALMLLTMALGVTSASAAPPAASMGSISAIGYTSAHVEGEVNPEDNETFYAFEYTTDPKGGGWSGFTFEGSVGAGAGLTKVEANLTGLKPGTEYFVRLTAWNLIDSEVSSKPVVAFATDPIAPPAVSIAAPTTITGSSAHFSGEINPGGSDPAFEINWRFQCTPQCPGLTGTIPADNSTHQVEADATGLMPGAAYEVSLVAENLGDQATAGPESFTTGTLAPTIDGLAATSVLSTEASLRASVNPGGLETSYHFEYGPTSSYGQSTPTETIPARGVPVTVRANLSGLAQATGYHYRLVASNSVSVTPSVDKTFTTQVVAEPDESCPNAVVRIQQHATYLPECRAYEQVSPPDKNGSDAVPTVLRTSTDGRGITWFSLGAYANATGANAQIPYAAHRTSTGWQTTAFTPSKALSPEAESGALTIPGAETFPGDLSSMVFVSSGQFDPEDQDASPAIGLGANDVYRVDGSGKTTWISHGQGVVASAFTSAFLSAVSEDGSTIFFSTSEPLTPEVPADGITRLYRWRAGTVEAVGRNQSGALLAGSYLGNGTSSGFPGGQNTGQLPDTEAASNDGSIFAYSDGEAVFLHQDGIGNTEISLSQRSGSVGQQASLPTFIAATPELRQVYFRSHDQLTDDAPVGGGDYVYSRESGKLTFSNPDDLPGENITEHSPFSGIVKVSDDGSYVYFTSPTQLDPAAVAGARNLYVRHGERTTLIATLAASDDGLSVNQSTGQASYPTKTSAGLSGDGRRLVFPSTAKLTGFDSEGHAEIYIYDASSRELECASCSPSGTAPEGDAYLGLRAESSGYTPRVISADGETVVFTTVNSLLPRDTNGVADVYEFRAGKLYLLSSGTSQYPSEIAGLSPDGIDAYMFTRDSLAPSDVDHGGQDVYDVRIDGGFLAPTAKSLCEGESCQGASSPSSAASGAASANLGSPNNVKVRHKKKHHKKRHHRRVSKHRNHHQGGKQTPRRHVTRINADHDRSK